MADIITQILNNAIKFFEEAFRISNCPSEEFEMQTVYLLVALNLKIGNQEKSKQLPECVPEPAEPAIA